MRRPTCGIPLTYTFCGRPSCYASPLVRQVTKLCDLAPSDTVCSVEWSRRGTYLSVGTNSGKLQIWDVAKLKLLRTLEGHRARVGTQVRAPREGGARDGGGGTGWYQRVGLWCRGGCEERVE